MNPRTMTWLQDQSIDEIKEIVTTTYQAPDQTEYSYPVVDQPMNDEQWQYINLGTGDGVLDAGGSPYNLIEIDNATNTAVLKVSNITGVAQAILRGFYHRLMANKTIDLPPVSTATTYYVTLRYDPLDHKSPTGPISVQTVTSLDYSQGKHWLVLHRVNRKPNQLLTDAEFIKFTPRVVPTQLVYSRAELPDPSKCLWGALYMVHNDAELVMAVGANKDSNGPSEWRSLTSPKWVETADGSSYRKPSAGYRVAIKRQGNTRWLRGRWERTNGNTFYPDSGYLAYSLSEGDRPKQECRFTTEGSGASCAVTVKPNGQVLVIPRVALNWISLDGVEFDVE